MKLIRFGAKDSEKPGVEINGKRLDCSAHFNDWNRDFFNNGGLNKLKAFLESDRNSLPEVDNSIRLGSPIARPGRLCVLV